MKKRNVAGLIVIVLFVIGIAVALMQYTKEQTYSDEQKNALASEKVVLSADENLFGMTTTDAPENYDITKDYYENYDNAGLEKYVIPIAFMDEESYIFGIRETKYCQYVYIDDSQDIVVEMTKEQREKWISKLKEKIDDIIHFLRREMLDFTAFPVFFVSNLLLVQRKKYYFNRATVSRNCSIVL